MDETREGELQQPNNPLNNPEVAPTLNQVEEASETSSNISPLKQIRTFQGDVASVLENQKESLYSIQQTEQIKRGLGGRVNNQEEQGKRDLILYVFGGIFLMLLGSFGAWLGYNEYVRRAGPPLIETPESRFISVQNEVTFNFASTSKETLFAAISEKSWGVAEDNILHFILKNGASKNAPLATTNEFFQKLNAQAPGSLVRSFDQLFMLGTLGNHRFLIFKVNSFENSFPGMLDWENSMSTDIGPLFATNETLKTIPANSVFNDVISKNKDVRVLTNTGTTTEPLLLYSFFENKWLIITDNLETLQTLVDRLAQELLSR